MDSVYLEIACDVCDTEIINIMATPVIPDVPSST